MGAQLGLVRLLNWPCLTRLYRLSRRDVLTCSETRALADFVSAFLLHPALIFSASLASIAGLNFSLAKESSFLRPRSARNAGVLRGEELTLPGDLKPFMEGGGRGKVQAAQRMGGVEESSVG